MSAQALTEQEIAQAMLELADWKIETSPRPDNASQKRVELVKSFKFRDYTEAIGFLASTMPHINTLDHHPRWESDFKTLVMRTCTHDAGYRITQRDFALAKLIDQLYAERSP